MKFQLLDGIAMVMIKLIVATIFFLYPDHSGTARHVPKHIYPGEPSGALCVFVPRNLEAEPKAQDRSEHSVYKAMQSCLAVARY